LQSDCPDSLKALIKKTNDDKLVEISYPWGGQYKTMFNWLSDENREVKISKYLIINGIAYTPHQESVILIAFKQKMLNQDFNEKEILNPYQLIELNRSKEDKVRLTTDSLRGFYIPKDLEDCFNQIDNIWSDSTKKQVKAWIENEFTSKTHLGFGMWMRNNWQLWGGSRLFAYFNNMGVTNPEDMSGNILASYHRHLIGLPLKLEEQIKFYKDYWEKVRKEDTLNKVKEFAEYKVGDTVIFKYRFDYTSKKQEDDSDNDLCKANGIVVAKNDITFQLERLSKPVTKWNNHI
jgi:uncharacterized protein DUF6794